MSKLHINFMGARRIFFVISGTLVVLSVIALATIGLNFGVEFQGGTIGTFGASQGATVESVRDALVAAEVADA
ncbi:MAG TPA: protein translocase subunit SecF, partial [Coriobacteriia bacterium]|nr:protein translocase subunit SecF [Coriobacteriia bacterium]